MNSFAVLSALSVILLGCSISDAKPMFQSLSAKDGYVPVYIRVGDTPLDEINPALANAFNEENILGRNIGTDVEAEMQADQPAGSNISSSSEEGKDEKKATTAHAKSSEESAESNESKVAGKPKKEEAAVKSVEVDAPVAKVTVDEAASSVKETAADGVDAVKEGASEVKDTVSEGASDVKDAAKELPSDVKDKVDFVKEASATTLEEQEAKVVEPTN